MTIHDGCAVAGLVPDGRSSTVVGVRFHEPVGAGGDELEADLVVDAAGRTSAVPEWLDALGCPSPPVDQVHVDVAYATRRYRMGAGHLSGDVAIINAPTPPAPRTGALALVEDDVGLVTLAGIGGDRPPLDADGFAAFARSLAFCDIGEAIAGAEPLDDPVPHRFPASTWRRYDRADRLPEGLAVLGDGVCSFNPIYGQGMTIAALGASALGVHLERHGRVRPRRYQRDLARIVAPAWEMAAGSDLQFPGVRGRRRRLHGPVSTYVRRLHAAAAHDAELSQAFVRVAGMVDPPSALLRPRVAGRVLRGSGR